MRLCGAYQLRERACNILQPGLSAPSDYVEWMRDGAVSVLEHIDATIGRRSAWLVGGAMAVCVVSLAFGLTYREWHQRAVGFEWQITGLELQGLAHGVQAEAGHLAEAARDLADRDAIAQLRDTGGVASVLTAAGADPAQRPWDGVLLVNAVHGVRYSAAFVQGRLVARTPDPGVFEYLNSIVAAHEGAESAASVGVVNDQLVAARPIVSRVAPEVTLGWLVVTRSLSPAMPALSNLAPGSLEVQSLRSGDAAARQPDTGDLTDELRKRLTARSPDGFGISTQVSGERSGYAVLHDQEGRAVWFLRLTRASSMAAVDGTIVPPLSGAHWALAALLAVVATALSAAGFFALQRQFQRQRSVDARYKAIIDQTNDGIVIVDSSTQQVQYCNPAFLARTGYDSDEAAALTLPELFADGAASTESVLGRLRGADSRLALNLQQRCKSGALIDIEVRCNTLDVDGRDVLAYVTHDVSVRRKAEQQIIDNQQRLDRMAHHDQLTGLPNRHYLTSFLPQAIEQSKADGVMLGVVFLDLDRFKHINDTRGHETGDKLLQEVAGRLQACVRDSDVVVRMGGDEFVVIFRNVKSYDEVTQGAGRIIDALNLPIVIDRHPLQTSGSVGLSVFPRDGADMGELLKHSDTAMYQAKERGRNNVQVFSPVMNRKLKHRVAMEVALREALRLKQLDVHYQPFVNLRTRKLVGLEALMRWRHPSRGMIPADQFIPVAEETGLIVPMGNFVLHRTLQTMSAWRRAGLALVPVSLNVAPAQLQRGELQTTISTLLKSHGLRPELLQLEMTERAIFDSSQANAGENRQDTIARLRDLGIKIAIDDFGTGYSSLSYLKNWRVDALKIDRSFVRDLATDSSDLAIVSAIIDIARHLQIQVIAEGIEAYQQAEILQRLGCSIGQGFLFSKPMPADQCAVLLGRGTEESETEEDILAEFAPRHA